jgi:hypothetical protein
MKNKKAQTFTLIAVLVILAVGAIAGIAIYKPLNKILPFLAAGNYEDIYTVNWGHIQCVQHFDYDVVYTKLLSQEHTFKCTDYTNECKIVIQNIDTKPLLLSTPSSGSYQICDADWGNCQASVIYGLSRQESKEISIPAGKLINFATSILVQGKDVTQITKKAKTFYLKGQENGKIYVQESCVLSSELKGKVLSDGPNEIPYDGFYNYAIGFTSARIQTYKDGTQNVICQARTLYKISSLTFKDGSTKKVQGDMIRYVPCCPTEANCGSNFEFIPNNERECTYSTECPNGGDPIVVDGTHYVTYSCNSEGICIKGNNIVTQCTTTARCIELLGQGYVCDLSNLNYGKCKQNTQPHVCGDNVCDELYGETTITCSADCNYESKKCQESGGKWIVTDSTTKAPWYALWRSPTTTSTGICRIPHNSGIGLALIIIGAILLGLGVFFLIKGEDFGKVIAILGLILLLAGIIIWTLARNGII